MPQRHSGDKGEIHPADKGRSGQSPQKIRRLSSRKTKVTRFQKLIEGQKDSAQLVGERGMLALLTKSYRNEA